MIMHRSNEFAVQYWTSSKIIGARKFSKYIGVRQSIYRQAYCFTDIPERYTRWEHREGHA
jgi:hypothetical protein